MSVVRKILLMMYCVALFQYAASLTKQYCKRLSQCICELPDGGVINLMSVGSQNGTARWRLEGSDGFIYSFNPCAGYDKGPYKNLAVFQEHGKSGAQFDLGVQTEESFQYSHSTGIQMHYYSQDRARQSAVQLICQKGAEDDDLRFLGEMITTKYDFILESPCACPNKCDNNGIITESGNQIAVPSSSTEKQQSPPSDQPSSSISSQKVAGNNKVQQPVISSTSEVNQWSRSATYLVSLLIHDAMIIVLLIIVCLALKLCFNINCLDICRPYYTRTTESSTVSQSNSKYWPTETDVENVPL